MAFSTQFCSISTVYAGPPFMSEATLLLFQVLVAAEDTLRRLQVSGAERNAILDTLRYMESLHERQLSHGQASTGPHQASRQPEITSSRADHEKEPSDAKPFTRCGNPEQHDMVLIFF